MVKPTVCHPASRGGVLLSPANALAEEKGGLNAMKILIITNHSYMLYRFRRDLIRCLSRNHQVVLSMPFVGHEEDFQAMGLKCIETDVDRRGMNPTSEWKLFRTYRGILKAEQPDLVITYSIKPNIYAGLACSSMKIPFCANVQGLGTAFQRKGLARIVSVLYKSALSKARTVFFENEGNAREFLDRGILDREKITILPGAGINLEDFRKFPYPHNESVRFLYLGRIMKEKGIDELFAATRRLKDELGDKITLDLVGFFDDDCEVQGSRMVEDDYAMFHGFQKEPKPYYQNADCVVLPSYHEGMSNVLLEAAACGRPVITSDIHGCREAVDPEISGFLCQCGDVDSLYAQMKRMALLSRKERMAMGEAGRKKMEQEFDKRTVIRQTIHALFGTKPQTTAK